VAVYSRNNSGVNTLDYLLSDHQASLSSITNSSGAAVVGESFTPFGARRNPNTWSGPPSTSDLNTIVGITHQGYTFQTTLGLWMNPNHMNGRVQDAITGRMLSADPHIPDRSNSQSYNRYTYVNNNPLTMVDPSGFFVRTLCIGVDWCPSWLSSFAANSSYAPPNGIGGLSGWGVSVDSTSAGSSDIDISTFA
jgi:RHS repeat-associated protein